ncbi:MAG: hypothetical protein J6A87_03670 [Clostridia bacterium]|nr:hypothetical protein [Clostridia bacterium]
MKLKKILLAVFLTVASACVVCGFGKENPLRVSAATLANTTSFTMEEGAAARIKTLTDKNGNPVESNGLRFSAEISQTEYDALTAAGARFGVVIVAKDLAKDVAITEETVFGANPSFYFSNETSEGNGKISMLHVANPACSNIDKDENIEICGSLVNIKTNNFTRSFIGRAYVAMPQTDESGEVTGYTYQFAPYFGGDIANNTRCIYYVAQRAVEEESSNADALQEKYIDVFAQTKQFTDYNYKYTVIHHYNSVKVVDGKTVHSEIYQQTETLYAQLNSQVTAKPIVKPNEPKLENMNFILDVVDSEPTQSGRVYAAGMQVLHLHYDKASEISEDHKEHTLETLVQDFLDPTKADENFHLEMVQKDENGNVISGTWEAEKVLDENGKQVAISLTTYSPNKKDTDPVLAKEFFESLQAFGVESITFQFYTADKNSDGTWTEAKKSLKFTIQESVPITICRENGEVESIAAGKEVSVGRYDTITIKLSDIVQQDGSMHDVSFNILPSTTDNDGIFHFGGITFGFPTESAAAL